MGGAGGVSGKARGRVDSPFLYPDPMGEAAYTLTVEGDGGLSLPAELREALHLGTGDRVIVRVLGDGRAELVTAEASVRSTRGLYAHLRGEVSPVEELLAERHAAAERE